MFWITGSQKFKMMQHVSESLAGRIAIFDMASLSTAEIEQRPAALFRPDLNAIRERLRYSTQKNIHEIYEDIFDQPLLFLFSALCTCHVQRLPFNRQNLL